MHSTSWKAFQKKSGYLPIPDAMRRRVNLEES